MNITSHVWNYAPKTNVSWKQNVVVEGSGGFEDRTVSGDPVDLIGYVTTPSPDKPLTNEQGEPLFVDFIVYFTGRYDFGIDDEMVFAYESDAPKTYLVRAKNYKKFGDYSMAGVQKLEERNG